ncbi:MAG: hypothetical protein AAF078_14620, partial [Planctomycetota bacterium]
MSHTSRTTIIIALAAAVLTITACAPPNAVQIGAITVGDAAAGPTARAPLTVKLDRDAGTNAWLAVHMLEDVSHPVPIAVEGSRFTLTFPGGPAHLEFIDVMGKTYTKGGYHTTAPDGTPATLPVFLTPELPTDFRPDTPTLPEIDGPWILTLADGARLRANFHTRVQGPLDVHIDLPGDGPTHLVGTAEPRGQNVPATALPADV